MQNNQSSKDFVIPARPDVLFKIAELVIQPDPSMDRIADLIKSDVSMYANTLAMINSPFFAVRGRVTSIHTAVRIMGLKRIKFIAEMAALRSALDEEGMLTQFWDDAYFCAEICSLLAERFHYLSNDDAYTLGMMNNCGIPLMYKECTGYKRFYEDNAQLDLYEQYHNEQAHFHSNHFVVSARIAKAWSVSKPVYTAIKLQPLYRDVLGDDKVDDEVCNILSILLIAKEMTNKYRDSSELGDSYEPMIETDLIYEQLSLTTADIQDMENTVLWRLNKE